MWQFKASAPGSLMLLGEYAVLEGKPAVVVAVDKRINVTVTPRLDTRIEIQSALHGHYVTDLASITPQKPFQFVLGVLQHYQQKLRYGCDINIVADFSDKVGLGSSAAVTVATLAALVNWLNIRVSPHDLLRQGRQIVRQVQGVGSGADVAASVYGGVVAYQSQPMLAEKFSITHPLTVLYAGFKTPTPQAIRMVNEHFEGYPQILRSIENSIGQCAAYGIQQLRKQDWGKFGQIMNVQQGLMQALGVSMPLLHNMVTSLKSSPTILGAKISGAGLGDCVVGLGELSGITLSPPHAAQPIPVVMTLQGVQCEKI